jgi:hypothetical protein
MTTDQDDPYEVDGADLNELDRDARDPEPPEPGPYDFLNGVPAHEIGWALAYLHGRFASSGNTTPTADDVATIRARADEVADEFPGSASSARLGADILALIVGQPQPAVRLDASPESGPPF